MSAQARAVVRRLKYTLGADILSALIAHTSLLDGDDAPPERINYSGGGDFTAIGDEIVEILCDLANLQPGQVVLEIGCGIGRSALALHRQFGDDLKYLGFDVVAYGPQWTKKALRRAGSSGTAYTLIHADIFNSFYNPRGRMGSTDYRFEAADGSVDLVFATSVFTHMQPADCHHFLAEAMRVLRPGGVCAFTAFVWDTAAAAAATDGLATFRFAHKVPEGRIENPAEPDLAVAHVPTALSRACGVGADIKLFPGSWRGTPGYSYQDYMLVRKPLTEYV